MGKKMKKWLCVLLAVVLMASALPLIAGAIAPSTGSAQGASSSGQSPLKVEIRSNKDKYSLLGKMEFTATITNISDSTVENISAQALLGSSLRPLKNGSQFTATKASLAPAASFSFKYCADLNGLKGLDNLLLPLFWFSSLFHGGKASIGSGNGGADYIEASKAVGVNSWFGGSYDASTGVKVWYNGYILPALDDKEGVWNEVINRITDIIDSVNYTGNYSRDSALAQKAYEDIISLLDGKKQQGYVINYFVDESGISYRLSTGLVGGLFWHEIYSPSRLEEVQTHDINQGAPASLATTSVPDNKLNIAVLQPRYSMDGFLGSQFKTSVFDDTANNIVNQNSNYQFTTSLKDTAVTIDVMKNLENNRIIIFDSHGGMIPAADYNYSA